MEELVQISWGQRGMLRLAIDVGPGDKSLVMIGAATEQQCNYRTIIFVDKAWF